MNDRLYRSVDDRVISGVCGGLADRFDLDPSLVRIGWVVLAIATGGVPLLILYVLMAVVVPEEPTPVDSPVGSEPTAGADSATGSAAATDPRAARLAAREARRAERHARAAGRATDGAASIVLGAILILVGVVFLVRQYVRIDWDVIWPLGLVALGVVVLVASLRPRAS